MNPVDIIKPVFQFFRFLNPNASQDESADTNDKTAQYVAIGAGVLVIAGVLYLALKKE